MIEGKEDKYSSDKKDYNEAKERKAEDTDDDRCSESDDEEKKVQYKVILLGDGTVGKTSIATRFTQNYFGQSYKQTIGLDFFTKHLKLPGGVHVSATVPLMS